MRWRYGELIGFNGIGLGFCWNVTVLKTIKTNEIDQKDVVDAVRVRKCLVRRSHREMFHLRWPRVVLVWKSHQVRRQWKLPPNDDVVSRRERRDLSKTRSSHIFHRHISIELMIVVIGRLEWLVNQDSTHWLLSTSTNRSSSSLFSFFLSFFLSFSAGTLGQISLMRVETCERTRRWRISSTRWQPEVQRSRQVKCNVLPALRLINLHVHIKNIIFSNNENDVIAIDCERYRSYLCKLTFLKSYQEINTN